MFATHLRRSPARWFAPFALALTVGMLLLRDRYWIGIWPETSAAAQLPALLVSSVAAAAAAWSAGTPVRHGMVEQALPLAIPRWRRELMDVGAVALFFTAVTLVGQAIGLILTVRTNPPGFGLWPGYAIMGLVAILLGVAFGHFVGKVLSGRFAAAVAGLAWLLIGAYPATTWGLGVVSGPVYMAVDSAIIVIRLVTAAALVGLAVALPPMTKRVRVGWPSAFSRRHLIKTWRRPASALVVLLLVVVTVSLGSPVKARPAPSHVSCVGDVVELCVWPEHQKYLPELEAVAARAERLPEAFNTPSRMEEYGISYRVFVSGSTVHVPDRGDRPPYFYIHAGSIWSVTDELASTIVNDSLDFCRNGSLSKGEVTDLQAVTLEQWIETHLAGGGYPDYRTSRSDSSRAAALRGVERANEGSLAEQYAWAVDQLAEFNAQPCR